MSENCRARNSDKKEGGQLRRRRSEICGDRKGKQEEESRKGCWGEGPNSRRMETGRNQEGKGVWASRERGAGPPCGNLHNKIRPV